MRGKKKKGSAIGNNNNSNKNNTIVEEEDKEEEISDLKQENYGKTVSINSKRVIRKTSMHILEKRKKSIDDVCRLAYVYVLLKYFFDNNSNTKILNEKFYLQDNILNITESLIGQILWVFDKKEKKLYGSRIVELESYNGVNDKASHAYNNKRTNRNFSMFERGGISYVYLCYGIHNCLNIVTNVENVPDAILVRSLEPLYSIENCIFNKYQNIYEHFSFSKNMSTSCKLSTMETSSNEILKKGREKDMNTLNEKNYLMNIQKLQDIFKMVNKKKLEKLCSGPGCVTKCLGITKHDDRENFYINEFHHMEKKQKDQFCIKGEKGNDNSNKNGCEGSDKNGCENSNQNGNKIDGQNIVTRPIQNSSDLKSKYFDNKKLLTMNGRSEKNSASTYNINYNEANKGINMENQGMPYENINSNYYFSSNINYIHKSRFFVSICPTINEIINFYEKLIDEEKKQESFIKNVYNEYKTFLLEYFDYMKWHKDKWVIQKDKRIGVNYAEEAALYEYRFLLKNHPSVSVLPK
ncbi:DNA-3-methyladenine glycosylase [Plasmodium brasilianum]|uniref:DNA-3-methyladenine glycosylase II n=2 Tax=Plasmodium (Plasmodium) TaxID=418103 RepID=A0A1A8W6F1_PLAMA|nr:DNA-3-methyladenine glycosylase, putative [Plasmodium malariae]KAI4836623.1 DNA-3-methyladenine glycosylase [Plasmodium brasilianum]SBS88364.1 DNA-3-methyladenine glycosylase, putative [Plasmodium malariae]SCO93901.1 DNA-3-methyladenine glycosylase, putative [Plasmodium malariae]